MPTTARRVAPVEGVVKTARRWTCPSCGHTRSTPFCSQCGEQPLRPRDLTFRDLVAQFARVASSIDGRLMKSLRALLTAPGTLTAAHIRGQRRGYLGPLQLFLIANALFFTMQSLTQTNIFSSPIASHLHGQDWSALARTMVADHLQAEHATLASYAPVFDNAAVLNAKTLIILMALVFAPLLPLVFYGSHRPFGVHVVFSLHLYAFVLLLLCGSLLIVELDLLRGGAGLASPRTDLILSLFNLATCAAYIYLATGPAYGATGIVRVAKSVALAIAVAAIVVGYRFGIFLITLYTT